MATIVLKKSIQKLNSLFFRRSSFRPQCYSMSTRLVEIGKVEPPREQGKYESGQIFIHRLFGYRGVILFPWAGRVHDMQTDTKLYPDMFESGEGEVMPKQHKEDKGQPHMYYMVLMDQRDDDHIVGRKGEALTFLNDKELLNPNMNNLICSTCGLDYVWHEDIVPYSSSEKVPITHSLFHEFLSHDSNTGQFTVRDALLEWRNKNHPWLTLKDVYRETTDNISVTTIPFYLGHTCRLNPDNKKEEFQHWWRYIVRLENLGEDTVKLRMRHWIIFSGNGTMKNRYGRGVVGEEPVLSVNKRVYQYVSHVSLLSNYGLMWGTYDMDRADGKSLKVRIPRFRLEAETEDAETEEA